MRMRCTRRSLHYILCAVVIGIQIVAVTDIGQSGTAPSAHPSRIIVVNFSCGGGSRSRSRSSSSSESFRLGGMFGRRRELLRPLDVDSRRRCIARRMLLLNFHRLALGVQGGACHAFFAGLGRLCFGIHLCRSVSRPLGRRASQANKKIHRKTSAIRGRKIPSKVTNQTTDAALQPAGQSTDESDGWAGRKVEPQGQGSEGTNSRMSAIKNKSKTCCAN